MGAVEVPLLGFNFVCEIQTRDTWIRSVNATSMLCHLPAIYSSLNCQLPKLRKAGEHLVKQTENKIRRYDSL